MSLVCYTSTAPILKAAGKWLCLIYHSVSSSGNGGGMGCVYALINVCEAFLRSTDERDRVLFFSAWANKHLVQIQLNHAELITCKTWNCCFKSMLHFPALGRLAPVVSYYESPREAGRHIGSKGLSVVHADSCLPENSLSSNNNKQKNCDVQFIWSYKGNLSATISKSTSSNNEWNWRCQTTKYLILLIPFGG